ncbi:MAG: ABC transporter ATP-binding protein [Oscillospiraceae bacterium]|jgi:ABC-2 type transport system ATP-binding protein|nr:ABC transporter ATP-binding protein [Oscillospiraceae bacterium]
MDFILRTSMLTKVYRDEAAVSGVNISIQKGDIYGLIGKNGAGKTTLMRLILGIVAPTEGRVELFGGKSLSEVGKKIGSIIEIPAIYPYMSAKENLEAQRLLLGIEDESIVGFLLEKVGLLNVGKKKADKFSLGMKQRLSLALSLMGSPELLILDEPTNGLDPSGIREVRQLIKELCEKDGVTILISSHLLTELSRLATRYGIMNKGKLVEEFTAAELDERAKPSLLIKVDNVDKSTEIIEKDLKTKNFKIRDSNTIELFENEENPGKINKLLSENGIIVESIFKSQVDLEEYFLKVIDTDKAEN